MWCLLQVPGIPTVKVAQRSSSTTPFGRFLPALIYHSLQLLWQHLLVCLLEWRVSASYIPLTGADVSGVWGRDAAVFRLCKQQIWDLHGRAATIIPVTLNIIVLSVFVCLSVRLSFCCSSSVSLKGKDTPLGNYCMRSSISLRTAPSPRHQTTTP